jgi:hypothetical protein
MNQPMFKKEKKFIERKCDEEDRERSVIIAWWAKEMGEITVSGQKMTKWTSLDVTIGATSSMGRSVSELG